MRNIISLKLMVYLLLIAVVLFPYKTNAEEIFGDINNNGVVGLEEAIYALQVAVGMRPATIVAPDLGPRCSAWGTYTYAAGIISANFTFSNFTRYGPSIGSFQFPVQTISATSMTIRTANNILETWTRKTGTAGNIVGRWERNDNYNNTFVVVLDDSGQMIYSAYGDAFTKTVDIIHDTKTIDGNFSDWSPVSLLPLYNSEGDCGDISGRKVTAVFAAQDDNYIYLSMILDGPPDPTFRYKFGEWFHIRVTPPPAAGIMLASSVCGKTFQNGLVAFGKPEDHTENQFELRFNKCDVDHWHINELSVWSDQDDITVCRHTSRLPILKFDFSMCDN